MKSSTPDPAVSLPARAAFPTVGGKYFALAVLFTMNLLNYVDRYSFFAVGKPIQDELDISNTRFGWLGVAFMIVYTFISPLMGWLGDRYNRKVLLASGVGLWSLATVGTAFSADFYHMFFWRALLGVGEASYGVIAPPLLADLFEPKHRGRVMGVYYLALPLGIALGYFVGGLVGTHWGWRHVFFVVGLPGLLAAVAGLLMRDPGRGASEGAPSKEAARPRPEDYVEILRTPTFLFNTAGMAAVTFATGAYAAWGSTFYQHVRGMSLETANSSIGALLAAAGLIGIALGTFLADALLKLTKRAYLVMATFAVLGAVPLGICGILDPERVTSLSFLFAASVLLSMVLGPCNTVTANVVPANRRAAGFALFIFLIHLFGDIVSPPLLGWISDFCGKPEVANSALGTLFASIGAGPVGKTNLTIAMLAVAPVIALGCVFFLLGSRTLPADQEKVRKAGGAGADLLAEFHH
jgi:MFS transporter, Spinster family, sphingosine-1-phosphate transporter